MNKWMDESIDLIFQKWHICISKLAVIVLEFESYIYIPYSVRLNENVGPVL